MSFVERTVDQGNIEKKVCVYVYMHTYIYIKLYERYNRESFLLEPL